MALIWREGLNTGLDWQDEQHKQIFMHLDDLQEAMQRHAGSAVIKRLVDFLCEYTEDHLQQEERYMQEHDCKGYHMHKRAHNKFLFEFRELKEVFDKQGSSSAIVLRLHNLLRDWLLNHIMSVDQCMRDKSVN